jgi:hypothetical protein
MGLPGPEETSILGSLRPGWKAKGRGHARMRNPQGFLETGTSGIPLRG